MDQPTATVWKSAVIQQPVLSRPGCAAFPVAPVMRHDLCHSLGGLFHSLRACCCIRKLRDGQRDSPTGSEPISAAISQERQHDLLTPGKANLGNHHSYPFCRTAWTQLCASSSHSPSAHPASDASNAMLPGARLLHQLIFAFTSIKHVGGFFPPLADNERAPGPEVFAPAQDHKHSLTKA